MDLRFFFRARTKAGWLEKGKKKGEKAKKKRKEKEKERKKGRGRGKKVLHIREFPIYYKETKKNIYIYIFDYFVQRYFYKKAFSLFFFLVISDYFFTINLS